MGIWVLLVATLVHNGTSVTLQEYPSEAACRAGARVVRAAITEIMEKNTGWGRYYGEKYVHTTCFLKPDDK